MNTNRHKYRWTCLAATPSREEAPRERGRPARTTLAQPHPSPPPGSTGNGPTIPLQPSPDGSGRQGGRVPHRRETERPPNPEDAGETPALPEGRLLPSFLLREEALPLPMRQCRPASCAFVDSSFFCCFRQAAPPPPTTVSESETRDVHGLSGTRFLNFVDWEGLFFLLFQTSGAPAKIPKVGEKVKRGTRPHSVS